MANDCLDYKKLFMDTEESPYSKDYMKDALMTNRDFEIAYKYDAERLVRMLMFDMHVLTDPSIFEVKVTEIPK